MVGVGQERDACNGVATQCGMGGRQVETVDRVVAAASEQAEAGATVLLSPACSSLDRSANFSTRGEHCTQLVAQYQARAKTEVDA